MKNTATTRTDWAGDYFITSHATPANDCVKEGEYLEDDYEWMVQGWNKPYLILLNLLILKVSNPRTRSLIQFQLKYPKHL